MHGVEASSKEAGGTQEAWTVPEPGALWEFRFGKEDDFLLFQLYFWKVLFLVLMDLALLRKSQRMLLHDSWEFVCLYSYLTVCFYRATLACGYENIYTLHNQSQTAEISQISLYFSHIDHFLPVKRPTLWVSDCFMGCCCTEYYTNPPLPFARIKFRKKIIFMRVMGVGINGWIIFRKRRSSSLRWAVSHSNVLVITQHIMPGRRCSPAAAYMPSTGWTRMCVSDCVSMYVYVHLCVSTENIHMRLHTVLYLCTLFFSMLLMQ